MLKKGILHTTKIYEEIFQDYSKHPLSKYEIDRIEDGGCSGQTKRPTKTNVNLESMNNIIDASKLTIK